MALDAEEDGDNNGLAIEAQPSGTNGAMEKHDKGEEEEDEDEEEDDEPRLKYASLTKSQVSIYRNGDATSAFMVTGDKMIIGTHNGNIHVLSLPSFQSLRVYHAHSASVTAVSVSPNPPPFPIAKSDAVNRISSEVRASPTRSPSSFVSASPAGKSPQQPQVPATPSNAIHIATSSIDGNVCVSSLVDAKDVLLRNFGRPVQAVALSPDYKNDRSYLSGGLAGNLVLTTGGRSGTSSTSNTVGGAALSSGWLGTIGLGSSNGTDTVLHSGEGSISTIKWSLSGKYVVWVNEQGIKIMRSNLHLEATESELAWKRISHIDRPNRPGWDEMAGLWKARAEWINEDGLEPDGEDHSVANGSVVKDTVFAPSLSSESPSSKRGVTAKRLEKLLVGWGESIWIINVHTGMAGVGRELGERKPGRVEIVTILRTDCIVSGISLYTPNLLLVLAYVAPDERSKQGSSSAQSTPKRGVHRRQNGLQPEMRIIDINTKEEVCPADTLNISRFESLSATDYHLGVLPVSHSSSRVAAQRGALGVIGDISLGIGGTIWDATMYPARLFTSAASVTSGGSGGEKQSSSKATSGIVSDSSSTPFKNDQGLHPATLTRGMKIFIQSPYDCVLATRPTISDHLVWLESHEKYEEAWNLLDTHPETANTLQVESPESVPSTPTKTRPNLNEAQTSLVDFFADDGSQNTTSAGRAFNSQAEKEKRRIGENWLKQLTEQNDWTKAGQVAGRVLGTSSSWEHWVYVFAEANKYAEITPYIPTEQLRPPLPPTVYEMILGHYISQDRARLKEILEKWPPELFDVGSIITTIESKLRIGDVREDTIEGGEVGQDWRILMQCLTKLYLADGRAKDALKCCIKLQDADEAMHLIKEHHLIDVVSDDIPGLILLRISKQQAGSAPVSELEALSLEPIRLLVEEAYRGIVPPSTVIKQLQARKNMSPYLFFYFRALWNGDTTAAPTSGDSNRLEASEGKSLVNDYADTALNIFASYSRSLLFSFLQTSQSYSLSLATTICEQRPYIPELVFLLAKQGCTNRALFLIIDQLGDISQAIAFAKEQNDPELWNDLLDFAMEKPAFVKALLEEVGTAIEPVTLVRRVPEGLEIPGLRHGLSRILKEYELQDSIGEGVARVLRGEVVASMERLRGGRNRGVKFEVSHVRPGSRYGQQGRKRADRSLPVKAGHCTGCGDAFAADGGDKLTMVGFVCGHIFHLPCYLSYDDEGYDDVQVPASEQNERDSVDEGGVGRKVRRARELRGMVGRGCPVAVHKSESR